MRRHRSYANVFIVTSVPNKIFSRYRPLIQILWNHPQKIAVVMEKRTFARVVFAYPHIFELVSVCAASSSLFASCCAHRLYLLQEFVTCIQTSILMSMTSFHPYNTQGYNSSQFRQSSSGRLMTFSNHVVYYNEQELCKTASLNSFSIFCHCQCVQYKTCYILYINASIKATTPSEDDTA